LQKYANFVLQRFTHWSKIDVEARRIIFKMKILQACPNGSCLYISLLIGIQIVQKLNDATTSYEELNGFSHSIQKKAQSLRLLLRDWFYHNLDSEIQGYGPLGDSKCTRGDILLLESEIDETTEEKFKTDPALKRAYMLRYLETIKRYNAWASTPEYIAFAYISKINIKVWQLHPDKSYFLVNEVRVTLEDANDSNTIHLLYSGSCHYDVYIPDSQESLLSLSI